MEHEITTCLARSLAEDSREISASLREVRASLMEELRKEEENSDLIEHYRYLEKELWKDKQFIINEIARVAKHLICHSHHGLTTEQARAASTLTSQEVEDDLEQDETVRSVNPNPTREAAYEIPLEAPAHELANSGTDLGREAVNGEQGGKEGQQRLKLKSKKGERSVKEEEEDEAPKEDAAVKPKEGEDGPSAMVERKSKKRVKCPQNEEEGVPKEDAAVKPKEGEDAPAATVERKSKKRVKSPQKEEEGAPKEDAALKPREGEDAPAAMVEAEQGKGEGEEEGGAAMVVPELLPPAQDDGNKDDVNTALLQGAAAADSRMEEGWPSGGGLTNSITTSNKSSRKKKHLKVNKGQAEVPAAE